MTFSELLNKPLPSKTNENTVEESAKNEEFDATAYLESMENEVFGEEDDLDTGADEGDLPSEDDTAESKCGTTEKCGNPGVEDGDDDEDEDDGEDDDVDDIDLDVLDDVDDLSDEDLAKLDASLSGDEVNDASDDDDDSDTPQEELSPDEEVEADDMMSTAATSMLVKDQLNAQERADFLNNEDEVSIAVNEGFLTEADVNRLAEDDGLVTESRYNQKMIIRLDANSKKKQLYALAVNVSAAAHNDPDYIKLKTVMKMRRILRAKLERKYHNEATKRMRVYFKRLNNSKSRTLSNMASKKK